MENLHFKDTGWFEGVFREMHPGFFEREHIRIMDEDEIFHEMMMDLKRFDPNIYQRKLSDKISYGIYKDDLKRIQQVVSEVDPDWVKYFNAAEPIYCGYYGKRPVSFCLITDFGIHKIGDVQIRIGGPGCVGTIPEFRDRGIGLTMVKNVTVKLKHEGNDYAYIHFTSEAPWYAKLGYMTCLRWTSNGIIPD